MILTSQRKPVNRFRPDMSLSHYARNHGVSQTVCALLQNNEKCKNKCDTGAPLKSPPKSVQTAQPGWGGKDAVLKLGAIISPFGCKTGAKWMQKQPGKSGLRYELRFYKSLKQGTKKERSLPFCLGYDRSHNSLFVSVIFSDSKSLRINRLQKFTPFSENCPKIRLDS